MSPPFAEVEERDWAALIAKGRASDGVVPADDVTRVLRRVELSEDVITEVRSALEREGITVDESVADVDADVAAVAEAAVAEAAVAAAAATPLAEGAAEAP